MNRCGGRSCLSEPSAISKVLVALRENVSELVESGLSPLSELQRPLYKRLQFPITNDLSFSYRICIVMKPVRMFNQIVKFLSVLSRAFYRVCRFDSRVVAREPRFSVKVLDARNMPGSGRVSGCGNLSRSLQQPICQIHELVVTAHKNNIY